MISYEPLYKKLRELKMTMKDLSVKVGFDERSLSSIAARHQHITTETLSKICETLSCGPSDIFEFVEEEPEHKRVYFRKDWQYSSDEYVIVRWEKLLSDIKESGMSESSFSIKLGKPSNYIAMKKNRKYTKKEVLKEIAGLLGKPIEEYYDQV